MSTSKSESEPHIRHAGEPVSVQRFADIVASLRAPDGCPWDRAQTHASLRRYAIEEAYELADAIDSGDPRELCEELGDVLLQVVLHAQLATEAGDFTLQDVVDGISAKMLRRHPHVFGDAEAGTPDEVEEQWKAAKRAEGRTTLGGVPRSMPALERAQRISERAARVGFDFPDANEAFAKVREEAAELDRAIADGEPAERVEAELGDLLFATVNVARKLGLSAVTGLVGTVARFERRFAFIEGRLARSGRTPEVASLTEMDSLWDEAKREGY